MSDEALAYPVQKSKVFISRMGGGGERLLDNLRAQGLPQVTQHCPSVRGRKPCRSGFPGLVRSQGGTGQTSLGVFSVRLGCPSTSLSEQLTDFPVGVHSLTAALTKGPHVPGPFLDLRCSVTGSLCPILRSTLFSIFCVAASEAQEVRTPPESHSHEPEPQSDSRPSQPLLILRFPGVTPSPVSLPRVPRDGSPLRAVHAFTRLPCAPWGAGVCSLAAAAPASQDTCWRTGREAAARHPAAKDAER